MKKFGMIGAAGYIAPRHLKAIKDTGNELVVAMDINDSVGIMDSYFPLAEFFTQFEKFEEFIEDEKLAGRKLDYLVICSPNYLHLPHIKFALKNGIDVICEKPLVLSSNDISEIISYESLYGGTVNSILQLRHHPSIISLKETVENSPKDRIFDIDLTYMTCRGKWYSKSWKGDKNKSGGIAANIGIHFYDMLQFVFGPVKTNEIYYRDEKTCSGYLEFKHAQVRWFLSIDPQFLPGNAVSGEKLTYRSIKIADKELEFSGGFTELHNECYRAILRGSGYGPEENKVAIDIVEKIQNSNIIYPPVSPHHLLSKVKK
ncbi:Gfo/Idh/MocA family oxidoreductase [Alphaproteobacteria bacterium]|nr:Gfo/Idh/MocA family oxidoreductase [Alphaproteobacteria bacterium]